MHHGLHCELQKKGFITAIVGLHIYSIRAYTFGYFLKATYSIKPIISPMNFATNKSLLKKSARRGRKKKDSPTKLKVNPRENKTTAGEIKKNDIVGLTNVSGKSLVAQTVVLNHDLIEESKSKRDILKEEAAEKREIRRIKRLKQQSALLIQKTYRSSKVRKNTIKTASNVLSRKLHDLNMLFETLASHGKMFVVPPTIVISLLQQFLYISNMKFNVNNKGKQKKHCLQAFYNNNTKEMQNMLDNICIFMLSSLKCNVQSNNLGYVTFAKEMNSNSSSISKYSIQRFMQICLFNIITREDILDSIQLQAQSNANKSVKMSGRVELILYILSSCADKSKDANHNQFYKWVVTTVFQNGSGNEHNNNKNIDVSQNWFIIQSIRSSIINIISNPIWEQQVLSKNQYKTNKCLQTVLSNSILPVVAIGKLIAADDMNHRNDNQNHYQTNKNSLYFILLDAFFSIPYFFLFVQTKILQEYILNIYPELLQLGGGVVLAGKDLNTYNNNSGPGACEEILHCTAFLSMASNISALFNAYKLVCEQRINNAVTPDKKQQFISKLQSSLIAFCKFVFTFADYLPSSTFESHNEFVVVKKIRSSISSSRQSSFRLPALVVKQLHVIIAPNNVQFFMRYLLPVAWEPNPTVTQRIHKYTVLEKDLTTEEETAQKGVWGRFIKSASWAKKVFVGKKKDVSLETWDNEGHVNNNNNLYDTNNNGRKTFRASTKKQNMGSKGGEIQKGSRELKVHNDKDKIIVTSEPQHVDAFCSMYMKILWRWWPGMSTQMVSFNLLNTLAYRTKFAPIIWAYLETTDDINKYILSKNDSTNVLGTNGCQCSGALAMIGLFSCVYNHIFTVLDDNDLYTLQKPVPIASLIRYILRVKVIIYKMFWETEDVILDYKSWNHGKNPPSYMPFALRLRLQLTSLMKALFDRNSRQAFCNVKTWLIEDLHKRVGKGEHFVRLLSIGALEAVGKKTELSGAAWEHTKRLQALTAHYFLQAIPFTISFVDRLRLFNHIIKQARDVMQNESIQPIRVRIKRSHVFEDGFKNLNRLGPRIRQRLYVNFIDNYGNEESGIDAGGLFKEFWTSLSKIAFNINYGLWALTENNLMYPSPTASLLHDNSLELYEFLGRVLGKAMFEGIVVNPNFTFFFLRKLLGKTNTLSDLPTLDPELYKNLMFLKNYQGEVDDLALAFTAIDTALGTHKEVPLIPNGENIPVTNENKLRYIYMVAHYRLNVKLRPQCNAFIHGMRDVIPVSWLGLFSENELQSVISGINKTINIDELQQHAKYVGGYSSLSPAIRTLWDVLRSFNQQDRQKFLHFVTSCERAPPLGFAQLEPKFTVQWVPNPTGEKLPSASTCFNILKLPDYKSKKILKEKILYSIRSNSGFGLT
jgi:ubiquitin-protein ligase E3 C